LDFFKYAQTSGDDSHKRKTAPAPEDRPQNKKKQHIEQDDDERPTEEPSVVAPPRHRVTAKGSNVPEPVDSFAALIDRYNVSSHLLSNLTQYGFIHPTGIQSQGIPILLEVRLSDPIVYLV
jgi:ATP-dependent RNA helicase DDX52/ROK1